LLHCIGNCGSRGGVGDDNGLYPCGSEDAGCFVYEGFAEKAGIAADEYAVGFGLSFDISSDACDCAPDVSDGEFIGYDGAPAGSTELDWGCHSRDLR